MISRSLQITVVLLARWSIWSCGFSLQDMIQSQTDVWVDALNLIYRLPFLNTADIQHAEPVTLCRTDIGKHTTGLIYMTYDTLKPRTIEFYQKLFLTFLVVTNEIALYCIAACHKWRGSDLKKNLSGTTMKKKSNLRPCDASWES